MKVDTKPRGGILPPATDVGQGDQKADAFEAGAGIGRASYHSPSAPIDAHSPGASAAQRPAPNALSEAAGAQRLGAGGVGRGVSPRVLGEMLADGQAAGAARSRLSSVSDLWDSVSTGAAARRSASPLRRTRSPQSCVTATSSEWIGLFPDQPCDFDAWKAAREKIDRPRQYAQVSAARLERHALDAACAVDLTGRQATFYTEALDGAGDVALLNVVCGVGRQLGIEVEPLVAYDPPGAEAGVSAGERKGQIWEQLESAGLSRDALVPDPDEVIERLRAAPLVVGVSTPIDFGLPQAMICEIGRPAEDRLVAFGLGPDAVGVLKDRALVEACERPMAERRADLALLEDQRLSAEINKFDMSRRHVLQGYPQDMSRTEGPVDRARVAGMLLKMSWYQGAGFDAFMPIGTDGRDALAHIEDVVVGAGGRVELHQADAEPYVAGDVEATENLVVRLFTHRVCKEVDLRRLRFIANQSVGSGDNTMMLGLSADALPVGQTQQGKTSFLTDLLELIAYVDFGASDAQRRQLWAYFAKVYHLNLAFRADVEEEPPVLRELAALSSSPDVVEGYALLRAYVLRERAIDPDGDSALGHWLRRQVAELSDPPTDDGAAFA